MSEQPALWEGFEFEPEQHQPDPQISDLAPKMPASTTPRRPRDPQELADFARVKITPPETFEARFPRIDHSANPRHAPPLHISELLPTERWIEEMRARVMPKLQADEARRHAEEGPPRVPAPTERDRKSAENQVIMENWVERNQLYGEHRESCANRWYTERPLDCPSRLPLRTVAPVPATAKKDWKPAGGKPQPSHYTTAPRSWGVEEETR